MINALVVSVLTSTIAQCRVCVFAAGLNCKVCGLSRSGLSRRKAVRKTQIEEADVAAKEGRHGNFAGPVMASQTHAVSGTLPTAS